MHGNVKALVRSLPRCPQGRHGTAASDDRNLCSDGVLPLCVGWGFKVSGEGGSGGAVLPVTLYRPQLLLVMFMIMFVVSFPVSDVSSYSLGSI